MNYKESSYQFKEKAIKVAELLFKCDDLLVNKFCEIGDPNTWDKKIEVLTRLNNGESPYQIGLEDYYSILDNYPKDGEMWD